MHITTHTLKNGLTVVLEENHKAPVVSYNVLVKVGSIFETDREAGMCHVIEHMLFKGTPRRKVGEIAREVEAAGGDINAYTSFDQTVYYINMASRFGERGLDILADAVINPLFDAEELKRETEVILEEIRRDRDNPMHLTTELLFSTAFKKHNYGRPIIGFEKTVKSFTRKDICDFYEKWYTPHNITLVIVGDFETSDILKKIEKHFGALKGTGVPARKIIQEPTQKRFQLVTRSKNIQTTYFALGFHIPDITHHEVPNIDVFAHILAGVESSRLEQVVKEKKRLVHQIYSYAYTPKDPGLFLIGGVMQTEKTEAALAAIWDEVAKLQHTNITEDELKHAKTNIRSGQTYERETVGGEGSKLAYFLATANSHEFENRYYQMLQDVQADDVRMAALKYITPERCTAILVSPEKEMKHIRPAKIKAACFKHIPKAKKIKEPKRPATLPKETRLSNGIRLLIRENHSLPIVSITAAAMGGIRFENKANNGINTMIARMLTKGTKSRSATELAQEIESIAGRIDGIAGRNSLGVTCEFLSDRIDKGFELFGDVLSSPAFSKSEVAKEKAQQIESIKNQEDSLGTLAMINFQRELFKKHPYGMRILGEPSTIRAMTPQQLRNYYFKIINPKSLVISVVGDVAIDDAVELLEKNLKLPTKHGTLPPRPAQETPPQKIRSVEIKKPGKEQANIVLGFLATRLGTPDHYTMTVLNHILAGQGGRLFVELRDKMSLAYAINSVYQPGADPGYLAIYIGTEPKKVATAITGIKREFEKITSKLVSNDELERAKQYIVGSHELESQRNSALAANYAFNVLYGLGIEETLTFTEKVMRVSREDIHRVAKKYFNLNAYTLSIVKP